MKQLSYLIFSVSMWVKFNFTQINLLRRIKSHLFIHRQLGGLVVKSFAWCAGSPGFDPRTGNQKIIKWSSSAKSQKACQSHEPCIQCSMQRQVKDPKPGNWEEANLVVDIQPYHFIITSASGSCSYKLIKLQNQLVAFEYIWPSPLLWCLL